jgi:four helix bundle protein
MKLDKVPIKTHKNLDVYIRSIEFVTLIYEVTKTFPKFELFNGIANQMRRAAVSIPSNIAEGAARQTNKEYTQFLYIASGSNSELEPQIQIAKNLKYIDDNLFNKLNKYQDDIGRMLVGLIKYRKSLNK